ncbi:MAG: hypothetical protein JO165_06715 [Candidatus Eremiobacteraeota bacterium]|nr:hypothetical protein [Candidatus Eremiobacteraeota bacterium]
MTEVDSTRAVVDTEAELHRHTARCVDAEGNGFLIHRRNIVHVQTGKFERLIRDFERFYALTARDGGSDWAIYEAPSAPSNSHVQSQENASA